MKLLRVLLVVSSLMMLTCQQTCPVGCTTCDATGNCQVCNTALMYFLSQGGCIQNQMIQNGMGPNLATGQVASCSDPNCNICVGDINVCTSCVQGYAVQGIGCTMNMNLDEAYFDMQSGQAIVNFNVTLDKTDLKGGLKLALFDNKGGSLQVPDYTISRTMRGDGFYVSFSWSNSQILNGILIISQTPSNATFPIAGQGLVYDTNYGITVPMISVNPPSSTMVWAISLVLLIVSRLVSCLTKFYYGQANPMYSVFFDREIAFLTTLLFMGNKQMLMTYLALSQVAQYTFLPGPLPNIFTLFARGEACVPPISVLKSQGKCCYFMNYGQTVYVYFILLLCVGCFIWRLKRKKAKAKSAVSPVADSPEKVEEVSQIKLEAKKSYWERTFNVGFIAWMLEGIMLQAMVIGSVTIMSSGRTFTSLCGFMISFGLVLYYGLSTFSTCQMLLVNKQLKKEEQEEKEVASKETKALKSESKIKVEKAKGKEEQDDDEGDFHLTQEEIENNKSMFEYRRWALNPSKMFLFYYEPAVTFIRNCLFTVCAWSFYDMPIPQFLSVLIVEGLYCAYWFVGRPSTNTLFNIMSGSMTASHVALLVLLLIQNQAGSEEAIQVNYAIISAALIFLQVVAASIYVCFFGFKETQSYLANLKKALESKSVELDEKPGALRSTKTQTSDDGGRFNYPAKLGMADFERNFYKEKERRARKKGKEDDEPADA